MSDPLATYNAKRDFTKTKEPAGAPASPAGNIFMVQKHDATRLHWDLRLELDGVLKSWAVTRGPSLDPADKRLAVRTEDHPLGYATFEGTIPKGQYGGGTVMLWDRGTWTPHPGKDPRKTLAEGHLHFTLDGERMKGEWIMIRLKPRGREKSENWLLRKVADEFAGGSDDLVERCLTSVATGRNMVEIAEGAIRKTPPLQGKGRGGGSQQAQRSRKPPTPGPSAEGAGSKKRKPVALPAFQAPQLATLVDHVPPGNEWLHEVKYDGYRCLLAVAGDSAKAYTRTGLDWSDKFASIVTAAQGLGPGSALIDGEVVALDRDGKPSFQALQNALKEGGALTFFAFDVLEQDGEDLTGLANRDRKARLEALLADAKEPIRYADHIVGEGEKLFDTLCKAGYEGVISKRADAPYRGRRSQSWLKIKCIRRQEFVIVGWTPSEKGRGFRSLLLGLYEEGKLRYAGKVGTGFGAEGIDSLMAKLTPLERKEPTVDAPRAAVRGAHWVEPKLVAEVAFAEFTGDGVLRHSSFVGLREDKPAADVVEEKPEPVEKAKRAKPPPAKPDEKPFGISISSRERVIFPESGITKGELADYYATVATPMLEWLADRPVSLVRCPQGRAKHCFFQKHDAGSFGDKVKKVPIREKDGHEEPYLYVDDGIGLMACVQMGTIEFHGWGAKVADVELVDRVVFDLDPDEGLGFPAVKKAAVFLRGVLGDIGLVSFPMLSGGKGVHVVVPLDATADWVAVKDFASRFAKALGQAHSDMFTANMKKTERKGRIFLDWLRNQRGATAVLPYSARARANATVAAPITWEELDETDDPGRFTIRDAALLVERAAGKGLKGWGEADQALPEL
jgi:bifunctional non-homologous end joining protein LigD